jgi:hypothetical protein
MVRQVREAAQKRQLRWFASYGKQREEATKAGLSGKGKQTQKRQLSSPFKSMVLQVKKATLKRQLIYEIVPQKRRK